MTKEQAALIAQHSAIGIAILALLYYGLIFLIDAFASDDGLDIDVTLAFLITVIPILLIIYFIYRHKSRAATWIVAIPGVFSVISAIMQIPVALINPAIFITQLQITYYKDNHIPFFVHTFGIILFIVYLVLIVRAIRATHKYHKVEAVL